MKIDVNGTLVEQVVTLACNGDRAYHRERERLYDVAEPEARERGFSEMHARRFREGGFDRILSDALRAFPLISPGVLGCVVVPVGDKRGEGAELFVAENGRRIVIRLRPGTILNARALEQLLRFELTFIADMLDPEFGYEPRLPSAPGGPTEDRFRIERYTAAWRASVVGRLMQNGLWPESTREDLNTTLEHAFPGVRDHEDILRRITDGQRPTHAELCQLACSSLERTHRAAGGRCPLCIMPTFTFVDVKVESIRNRIQAERPEWRPKDGACPQCADHYALLDPGPTPRSYKHEIGRDDTSRSPA